MEPVRRTAAKVLLVDPMQRVLLFSGIDRTRPDRPPVWFPVGGAVEPGESVPLAAIREVAEETGAQITDTGPALSTRHVTWEFEGVVFDQEETYFLVRTECFTPVSDAWTDVENATIVGHRWWTVDELRATSETVFPEGLAELLDAAL
jgi:8-oxo-dGTP pyrophosphatase MutT (NUDIX family)